MSHSIQDKKGKKLASVKSVAQIYWSETRKYKWAFALLILGNIGIQAADLAAPWFLRQFFNSLAINTPSAALASELLSVVGVIAAIYVGGFLARRLQSRSIMYLELQVMRNLTVRAFEHLIKHSYNFFVSNFAGTLTHKVNRFARVYEVLFDAIFLQFFPTFIFVLGTIVVLSLRHPLLGGMLLVWSIVFTVFQVWVASARQPARALRAEEESKATGTLADAISNHSTVMLFAGFERERSIVKKAFDALTDATRKVWYADDWIWSAMGVFMIAINIGMLYGATILWGQGLLTIGDFVLIQAYLLGTFDRLYGINRELRRFFDAVADAQEMTHILETPHDVKDKKGARHLAIDRGVVWFDDVSFNFHKGTPVLHQFNMTIDGGERIALVGPSGAGKSTVTKLLLRLYDVDEGAIKIDGQDISGVTQDSLRDAMAFVPQEPILFHRTLMDNIRYGWRDATDEQVIEAAKKAHCHEFISRLPEGYNTYVGERGIKLSGGERQRVAIARAILKDAPILVLDEATSSLDSESEAYIQDALETLMQGKTVIVIAHRLSTIMKMDRIIVMEKGSIVAQGTHLQLVNERGLYQKLWSIQAGGFIGSDDETNKGSIGTDEDSEEGVSEEEAGAQSKLAEDDNRE